MKRKASSILIFGLVLSIGLFLASKPVFAEPVKYTNKVDYFQSEPINITLEIPGGTDLFIKPSNIVLALDVSHSMLLPMSDADPTPRIDAAVSALKKFLDAAETIGGANKPRVGFMTFGSDGYWKQKFTKNYGPGSQLRKRIDEAKDKILDDDADGFSYWECTSTGDGLDEAVQRLVDDTDANPNYIILASDGAEAGQTDPTFPNKLEHTSTKIEDNNAIQRAFDNHITIHTVGVSKDVEKDLLGVDLGDKCTGIYAAGRTGENHLRDFIADPTGGTFTKIVNSSDLSGLYEAVFETIATDYSIQVYERFRQNLFSRVWWGWGSGGRPGVTLQGNGCSGASDHTSSEWLSFPDVPNYYGFRVDYNNGIPQGENRCITILTYINGGAPIADGQAVDFGKALDWYYVRIISGEQTWKVELNQAYINVKAGAWLSTKGGNLGSIEEINLKHPTPLSWANTDYLGISDAALNTTTFRSARGWLVPDYSTYGGIQLHGPDYDTNIQGGNKGGYDYYRWLWAKHPEKIQKWTKANKLPDCSDPDGCFYVYASPGGGIPDPGDSGKVTGKAYTITAAAAKKTTATPGTEPVVFFIPGGLHINVNNAILDWQRPYIFVIGGDLVSNVTKSPLSEMLCNMNIIAPPGPSCLFPVTQQKGFFFVNGLMNTLNPEGLTLITGSVVANDFDLKSDIGKKNVGWNKILPSDYFVYDPNILWYFREMMGVSQTSFKEVAP